MTAVGPGSCSAALRTWLPAFAQSKEMSSSRGGFRNRARSINARVFGAAAWVADVAL
jgi:hypothetical protein